MQATAKRCDINLTQCSNFGTFVIKDICTIAFQKDMIWSDLVAQIHPRPKCPLSWPSYETINATVDLAYAATWPIDDYTWIVTYKAFRSIANVRHKKERIFCVMLEVTVFKKKQQKHSIVQHSKVLNCAIIIKVIRVERFLH